VGKSRRAELHFFRNGQFSCLFNSNEDFGNRKREGKRRGRRQGDVRYLPLRSGGILLYFDHCFLFFLPARDGKKRKGRDVSSFARISSCTREARPNIFSINIIQAFVEGEKGGRRGSRSASLLGDPWEEARSCTIFARGEGGKGEGRVADALQCADHRNDLLSGSAGDRGAREGKERKRSQLRGRQYL